MSFSLPDPDEEDGPEPSPWWLIGWAIIVIIALIVVLV